MAKKYLLSKNYEIMEQNFNALVGEIDIIAKKGEYLVFVEVKTRKNDVYGTPGDFVTKSKRRKIIRAAQIYLEEHTVELQPRFDVVEVYYETGEITHIEDAF